jgi:tyrosine-protein kinase Etk/Wzc
MLDLDKQTLAIVTTMATLKGQIAAQAVQVQALRSFATSRNPDVIRAESELAAMRDQLAQMERRSAGGNGDIFVATKNLPASGLEFLRRYRDVKYYEELYELLGKQYEAAVVDEGTNGAIVQVVDPAVPPDKKSLPKRALIVLAFLVVGFLGSYGWAVAGHVTAQLALDPVQGPKIAVIREGLWPFGRWWTRIQRRGRATGEDRGL